MISQCGLYGVDKQFSSCICIGNLSGSLPWQELNMKVLTDKGRLVVAILDGKRRVRVGTRQSAGKEKAWGAQIKFLCEVDRNYFPKN